MNFDTNSPNVRTMISWLLWVAVFCMSLQATPSSSFMTQSVSWHKTMVCGVMIETEKAGIFPWYKRYRCKKHRLKTYRAWKKRYKEAKRRARRAKVGLASVKSIAQLVEWVTRRQMVKQIGAIPVLYQLLEKLEVAKIIDRHCPTEREVAHGTVALVLVINRLMMPLPMYRVADWMGRVVLAEMVGVEAKKFNDDRLGRTLDALSPHLEAIWLDVVDVALAKAQIDLSVVYYDLTAFITHGRYEGSELVDFGFAHNTPSNKRKFKLALNTIADGNIPWIYQLWSGRTTDKATVCQNLETMNAWFTEKSGSVKGTLLVGDRAMLNQKVAFQYAKHGINYLCGLQCQTVNHKALLPIWTDEQFHANRLTPDRDYYGRPCDVTFEQDGKTLKQQGLVVLSGPLRDQFRSQRHHKLTALNAQLELVRSQIGQPRMKTSKAVQRRVNARLKASGVARFVDVDLYHTPDGHLNMRWQRNPAALAHAERRDGRYLLVTNDRSLSPAQMFQLYRDKDGGEKRFQISKSDLKVSPVYLHKDPRIASLLFINMLALLAWSVLDHQMHQQGIHLTTRALIQTLQPLTLIESHYCDGSFSRNVAHTEPDVLSLWLAVDTLLSAFGQPSLTTATTASISLPQLTENTSTNTPVFPLQC